MPDRREPKPVPPVAPVPPVDEVPLVEQPVLPDADPPEPEAEVPTFDDGGLLPVGLTEVRNDSGVPETVDPLKIYKMTHDGIQDPGETTLAAFHEVWEAKGWVLVPEVEAEAIIAPPDPIPTPAEPVDGA